MAKDKSLRNTPVSGPAPSPFADGARRFEEMARTVKAQQVAGQQGAPTAAKRSDAPAPDEIWARKFMSMAIGPAGTEPMPMLAPVPHATAATAEFAAEFSGLKASLALKPDLARRRAGEHDLKPGPMAERLARAERPRRSWLGRLFRSA